jgi:hypothetical protein
MAALVSCALLLIAPTACTARRQENTSAPLVVERQQDASISATDAPVFKTPAWSRIDRERLERETKLHPRVPIKLERRPEGVLLLRTESTDGGALLLKHSALDSIYLYDPRTKNLSLVQSVQWKRAVGPIVNCSQPVSASKLWIDLTPPESPRLSVEKREVQTAGRAALEYAASPSGRWLAVLSAPGPAQKVGVALMSSRVEGPRYHQIFSLPDVQAVGHTLRLPLPEGDELDTPANCWTADERHVVYQDAFFGYISVIETGLSYGPNNSKTRR